MPKNSRGKIAIVGGGIAGTCASKLLSKKGYNVILFEKNSSLGGCAGSFTKDGFTFDVGATTIAGIEENYPVRRILSSLNLLDGIKIVDPSIVIHTPKGLIKRFSSLERTIDEINRIFPYRENRRFWSKVFEVTKVVLTHRFYHDFTSLKGILKSFTNIRGLALNYLSDFFIPAESGIRAYFQGIDRDYYDFMDSHVKIVAQSSIERVSFLTLLLALGYPFTGVGLHEGGMGELIDRIADGVSCYLKTEVNSIFRKEKDFIIKGVFGEMDFERVILAFPVLENMSVINDQQISEYFRKYCHLNNDNSAVLLYGVVRDFHFEEPFHLKILEKPIPGTSSKYLFFSFRKASKGNQNYTVFSVSTHTSVKNWINLNRDVYDNKKELIKENILRVMEETFNLNRSKLINSFVATPETFFRYIGRRSVGGIPITRENVFWRIPSNFTPFRNLYLVGDSYFCYQGWLGVSIGVLNLTENLNE